MQKAYLQFKIYQAVAMARGQGHTLRDLCFVMRPDLAKELRKNRFVLPIPVFVSSRIPENMVGSNCFASDMMIVYRTDAHRY